MRRIGGILFLLLLTACEPDPAGTTVEAETIGVEEVTTTSSTFTSKPTSIPTSTPPTTTTSTSTSTTVARATATTVAPVRVTVATTVPATRPAPVTSATTQAAGGGCDPNYAGACVPVASDVDCGGGSGNGPAYTYAKNIRVTGRDIYGLDADGDGVGCES
jgi:resuscitation-promoting factor RpfB